MLAIDTETTGLDPWHGCKPFFVSTCRDDGEIRCWEWHVNPKTREPIIPKKDIQAIHDWIESDDQVVFHNAKFDIRMLETIGISLSTWGIWDTIHDTLIASHVLWSNDPHGLKELALLHLDVSDRDEKDLKAATKAARSKAKEFGWDLARDNHPLWPGLHRKEFWGFDYWVPREIATTCKFDPKHSWHTILRKYAARDAERTIGLWLLFKEMLDESGLWEQYCTRRELLRITYKMEQRGVSLNRGNLQKRIVDCRRRGQAADRECKQLAVIDNLNSTKQLQKVLFGDFGLTPVRKTKTGWSTDADTVESLLKTTRKTSPAWHFLTNYQEAAKCETDVSHLQSYVEFSHGEPFLHSSINITGTRTTRFSTERPNSQNPDRKLRDVFGPLPGRWWLCVDYSNIELRMLAYAAGETELIQAFERGESVHMNFAWVVCPWAILNVPKNKPDLWYLAEKETLPPKKRKELEALFKETDQYHWVKNGDFALTYGASATTADETYHIDGAHAKIMSYFKKLKQFTRHMLDIAYREHRITTLGGYSLQIPVGREPTTAVDYYCQGSAGWIITEAMVNCQKHLDTYNQVNPKNQAYIIMQIHDELDFDIPENFHPTFMNELFRLMEAPGTKYGVPTPVEPKLVKTNWAEGVPIEWTPITHR